MIGSSIIGKETAQAEYTEAIRVNSMEIHFEINHGCLLNCRHCSSFATDNGDEMHYTIEDMKNFLMLFPQEKHVFLTGGEPLLCDDLDPLLFSLTNTLQQVSMGLFTTGIVSTQGRPCAVYPDHAQRLAFYGLKVCYFSLYAPSAQAHDWMTGVPGSFDLTLESIRNMRNCGIETRINLVVSRKNQDELHQIIALASRLGCSEVRLLKLICHGRAMQCWEDIGLANQEYQACVIDILNSSPNIRITASSYIELLPCRPFDDAQGCQAGSRLAYVTIDGDVYPCASAKNCPHYKIGNIKEIESIKVSFECQKIFNRTALCAAF